ncbi:MAG: ABC transporter ATP-binding protein [Clostridiaceae bacterium]
MIKVENIKKVYDNGYIKTNALNDININIPKGSFTAIVGESGSGKSTLLHIIGGLLSPTSGSVYIENTEITHLKDNLLSDLRCKKIGFIFQKFNLLPNMTVMENITIPIIINKRNPDDYLDQINELVDMVGLSKLMNKPAIELSGGQQQRVAIVRAIINNPDVILADEPTGNLDSKNSSAILELLNKLNKLKKKTIIMVTHSEAMLKHCDFIIRLKDSRVVE